MMRTFLLRIMAAMGFGRGFRHIISLLLANTRSAAFVNGVLSGRRYTLAGLRQGDCSAPPLYLFIGQALSCFPRARLLGITLGPLRLSGFQHADDLTVLLATMGDSTKF